MPHSLGEPHYYTAIRVSLKLTRHPLQHRRCRRRVICNYGFHLLREFDATPTNSTLSRCRLLFLRERQIRRRLPCAYLEFCRRPRHRLYNRIAQSLVDRRRRPRDGQQHSMFALPFVVASQAVSPYCSSSQTETKASSSRRLSTEISAPKMSRHLSDDVRTCPDISGPHDVWTFVG